ncbi:2Fe-2S iron-sulfur cluster-binding protein [Streptomyces aidingensis]|uniref:Aerobic-type carbon monoxide dehydrogenase, small subunit, CoxS/CutS family n=1 Tax=Streptomyces aidingensis TaxID=910347 RepID=A0A1I1RE38_9ACTN|nr:(2Fe-2S)-binding protein [Streptomyces aidingensis]SFD32559.1 Aerobic-type carbon monoxide dehydrogenase, small subunit, CoxS/CutS family [Streptomyces aidingensis]
MSSEQYPDPGVPTPQTGWGAGGGYDAEATAFIKMPRGPVPDGDPGTDPLAAPGQGYRPPEIAEPTLPAGPDRADEAGGPPMTAAATTDPAGTGQWTLPFGTAAGPVPGPARPPAPGTGATAAGRAAAMGQGAAAALAGAHQVRGATAPRDGGEPALAQAGPRDGRPEPVIGEPWSHPAQDGAGRYPDDAGVPEHGQAGDPPESPRLPGRFGGPSDETLAGTERLDFADLPGLPGPPAPGERAGDNGTDADSAGSADSADNADNEAGTGHSNHPVVSYVLTVNGVDRPVTDAWVGESLLYVLRERLGLAGAKDGCSQGECGACSVQLDGRLVAACLVPAATAAGTEILTVEGLADNGAPSDVQRALAAGAVQCGFCLPGMAMAVHDLLERNHAPTELEARQALCGNLCRCAGYRDVLEAVRTVAAGRAARHHHPHQDDGGEPAAGGGGDGGGPPGPHIPHQGGGGRPDTGNSGGTGGTGTGGAS